MVNADAQWYDRVAGGLEYFGKTIMVAADFMPGKSGTKKLLLGAAEDGVANATQRVGREAAQQAENVVDVASRTTRPQDPLKAAKSGSRGVKA
ncbi:MAG: hypothetical protein ACFCU3_03965 [Verrucomicrobiales bacterium]